MFYIVLGIHICTYTHNYNKTLFPYTISNIFCFILFYSTSFIQKMLTTAHQKIATYNLKDTDLKYIELRAEGI